MVIAAAGANRAAGGAGSKAWPCTFFSQGLKTKHRKGEPGRTGEKLMTSEGPGFPNKCEIELNITSLVTEVNRNLMVLLERRNRDPVGER